jgi:hypothetical protein
MNDRTLWSLATLARYGLIAAGAGVVSFGIAWAAWA